MNNWIEKCKKEYSCIFQTNSKTEYLRMLREVDKHNWRRVAFGDDWNCEFVIAFDMH